LIIINTESAKLCELSFQECGVWITGINCMMKRKKISAL